MKAGFHLREDPRGFQCEAVLTLQNVEVAALLIEGYGDNSPDFSGERGQGPYHFLTSSMMPPTFITRTVLPRFTSGEPPGKLYGCEIPGRMM